jgi:TolB protein
MNADTFFSSMNRCVRTGSAPTSAVLALLLTSLPANSTEVTRLTNINNSYPYPAPDGGRIVFQSDRTGVPQIYIMNADGSGLRVLTDDPLGAETPVFSPDGKHILFAAYVAEGNNDVFIMAADGGGRRRITDGPGYDGHPHFSFDGNRVVFNSDRTTPDRGASWNQRWHEIFSVALDGSDLLQHTHCQSVCTFGSLSPDGKKVLYRKTIEGASFSWFLTPGQRNSEVFIADADGTNAVNLSNSAAFDGWPRFSPDGGWIVFASNRAGPAGVGQLYLIKPDGSRLRRVTDGPWSYVQPAWGGDSSSLYAKQGEETSDHEFGDVVRIRLTHFDLR